ncbi:MAG: hypothetical protein IKF51_09330 [Solobacterium sp.]|nr:hypothetical protein [Solobacterium sp.]
MATKTTKKKTKTKASPKKITSLTRKERRVKKIFFICLALVLIPLLAFGWMLLSAKIDGGSPIIGNRYDGDLDPAITKSDLQSVEKSAKAVSGVNDAEVHLATGTLRVYADIADDAGSDAAFSTADQIYTSVCSLLDPSVYFTQHDGKKMYDLEVHVYNYVPKDSYDEGFVYVIKTRTSSMEEPLSQLVSEPIDAALAQELRDDVERRNNPQPESTEEPTEMEVSGEEG